MVKKVDQVEISNGKATALGAQPLPEEAEIQW